jgi:ABC-type transporter Mla subunit MlaD
MTVVDISGEMRELADAVEQLERQLEDKVRELDGAQEEIGRLNVELDDALAQIVFAESDAEVYELLADVKRGLLTVDELLDRTVGRP